MLSWVIQITVISIILIFLVHHLINFFKATLTVPKIKDLVNSPNQKYENIYNILKKPSKDLEYSESGGYSHQKEYTLIDLLPKTDEPSMKNELKNFLKKQLHTSNATASVNNMNISSLDSISSSSFSPF
jgi:uncharacterized membrane-anchored protein YitT (DUF2179 family)